MFHRGFRGSRRRTMRPVIQSYKKVIFNVGASFSSGFQNEFIAKGEDSVAAGQTSVNDPDVPTGSIIKYFEIQFAAVNAVNTPIYLNCTIQYTLGGQTPIDPNTVGGHEQRNQVLHMDLFSVGQLQNSNHKFKFKVPKKFQRLREGMDWTLTWSNSGTINRSFQCIYKFYR